jgi:hypothetical protein
MEVDSPIMNQKRPVEEILSYPDENSIIDYPNKKVNGSVLDYAHRQLINNMDTDPSKSIKEKDDYVNPQNENGISNPNSAGVLMAIVAKGAQDVYMTNDPKLFDARLQFLNDIHQFSYQKIEVKTTGGNKNKFSYTFKRVCDLVNRIDLVLPNPNRLPLNKIIKCIETELGGQRIDKIGSSVESFDIETLINTDCALFKRKISHVNGKTFIPLSMAPLYNHNMIQPSCQFHDFKINIEYTQEYQSEHIKNVELYGNIYYLDTHERRKMFNDPYSFITIQHQYTGLEKMLCGHTAFRLNFNHPMYLIYFWGFDKSKVRNIRICLNGHDFYNGSAEALENYKLSRGYDVEPMMFFFSQDDFDKPTKCTVNFSRIDSAQLYILSDQREATDVHIVGLNLQPIRFSSGMGALAFSK